MLFQSMIKRCAMKKCLQLVVLLLLSIAVAVGARARQGDEDIKPIFWRSQAAKEAHELKQLEEAEVIGKPSVSALLSHEDEQQRDDDDAVGERVAADAEERNSDRIDDVAVKLHDLKVGLGQLQNFAPPLVDVRLQDEHNVVTLSAPRPQDEQYEGKERHAPVHVEIYLENKSDEQPAIPHSGEEQRDDEQPDTEDHKDEQPEVTPQSGAEDRNGEGEPHAKQEENIELVPHEQPVDGGQPQTNQSRAAIENTRRAVGQRLPIVETDPSATFAVMYNADNPARCTVTRLQLLHPGETAILPNECGRIRCLDRSGRVSIVRCPAPEGPPPANCQLADPVVPRPLYPKCCERNLVCS